MDINTSKIMNMREANRLWSLEMLVIEIFLNFFFYMAQATTLSVSDEVGNGI